MGSIERVQKRCYKLGQEMPNKVSLHTLTEIIAKVIVQEKTHDEDAFKIASEAFAEGFNSNKEVA